MRIDCLAPSDTGRPEAVDRFADLLHDLGAHYQGEAAPSREAVRSHLVERLMMPDSPLRFALAVADDGRALGFAAVLSWHSLVDCSAERSRQLFLKELYVRRDARGRGVGAALMRWVARHAEALGCVRIDWTAEAGNAAAQAFYGALGAGRVAQRWHMRLDRDGLERLAEADDA